MELSTLFQHKSTKLDHLGGCQRKRFKWHAITVIISSIAYYYIDNGGKSINLNWRCSNIGRGQLFDVINDDDNPAEQTQPTSQQEMQSTTSLGGGEKKPCNILLVNCSEEQREMMKRKTTYTAAAALASAEDHNQVVTDVYSYYYDE